jgi:hypothetical protein
MAFWTPKPITSAPDRIVDGNQVAQIDSYPEGYFSTDAWTDRALDYMKSHVSSEPHKPFFMYMAFNAPHMPIQAKPVRLGPLQRQIRCRLGRPAGCACGSPGRVGLV